MLALAPPPLYSEQPKQSEAKDEGSLQIIPWSNFEALPQEYRQHVYVQVWLARKNLLPWYELQHLYNHMMDSPAKNVPTTLNHRIIIAYKIWYNVLPFTQSLLSERTWFVLDAIKIVILSHKSSSTGLGGCHMVTCRYPLAEEKKNVVMHANPGFHKVIFLVCKLQVQATRLNRLPMFRMNYGTWHDIEVMK